jgi:hypothetical protein
MYVATLYPLHVPPRLWHTMGLRHYLTHLRVSNGFGTVLIVVVQSEWNGRFSAM